MNVNSLDLESAWRDAWDAAPNGATTFRDALNAARVASREITTGGSIGSLSVNQNSHSYAPPSPNTRTTIDQERISLAAIKLYEKLMSDLGVASDDAGELAIYNEGIARFAVCGGEVYHDFSSARSVIA